MEKYLKKVKGLFAELCKYKIHQVPTSKNTNVDALAKLVFVYEIDLARSVPLEILIHHLSLIQLDGCII